MKKVRIADINGHTWEYYADEVSWTFYDDDLFVETKETGKTKLILKLAMFAYLEVVE